MANTRVKNSVGIWAFGPNATRFVPGGYHPEAVYEDMVSRTQRVVSGLADDNMVGAAFFMQTLELAMTLQDVN